MLVEGKEIYEDLDLSRCEGFRFAERKCRKLRKGQVTYSPQFDVVRKKIHAWT
jgi:hypothetical protein